ncbi:MAG: hypothetical protein GWO24_14190, partial [Akkermansiaceae bacterium]|nr:hypothetical protein [Akkermansiaceae bacterium]
MKPLDESSARDTSEEKRDHSSTVLILANLIPLAGVLVWDWGILNVVA